MKSYIDITDVILQEHKNEKIKKLLRMKTNTKSLEYCVDYVYNKLIK